MSIDSRLLIKQVKARPAIWKRDHGDYFQKSVVSGKWAEISSLQGVDEVKLKTKWKALRDTFRQELKKSSKPRNWSFYQDMSFLKDQLKWKQTIKAELEKGLPVTMVTAEQPEELIYVKEFKEEPPEHESDVLEEMSHASQDVYMNGDISSCPNKSMETDDDYHFLMSFLPEMRKLSPRKKMYIRIKMMELFYKEIY